ncbi:hypothetical protein D3C72_840750 [compost metagenome]
MGGKVAGGFRLYVVLGSGGNVVEIDRRFDGVSHRREMADQPILRAGDEEGRDDGDAVDADTVKGFGQLQGLKRGGHARIHDDFGMTGNFIHHLFRQPDFFLMRQRGEIAIGTGAHDVVAGRHLAAHLRACRLVIDGFVFVETGDERDEGLFGHERTPLGFPIV